MLKTIGMIILAGTGIGTGMMLVGSPTIKAAARDEKPSAEIKLASTPFVAEKGAKLERAIFAGGCFWGVEELLRKIPGVIETQVGYSGGNVENATYDIVKKGKSDHAEAVQILFDPKKVSYETLLLEFFKLHDPTTLNQQGNDKGTQYRSAIFFMDKEQKEVAEKIKARVDKSKQWKKPVVTEITSFSKFWRAEDEHQKYLEKTPDGYTCHFVRDLKF